MELETSRFLLSAYSLIGCALLQTHISHASVVIGAEILSVESVGLRQRLFEVGFAFRELQFPDSSPGINKTVGKGSGVAFLFTVFYSVLVLYSKKSGLSTLGERCGSAIVIIDACC
jgi:hypothetical protein